MIRHNNPTRIILIVAICLTFIGCSPIYSTDATTPLPVPSNSPFVVGASATPTLVVTTTATLLNPDVVITPDAILVSSTLALTGVADSSELCKQVPAPQITRNGNDLTPLNGRFALCVLREEIAAFDLDNGILVNSADSGADIQLGATQSTLDATVYYFVKAVNNAQLDEIDTTSLTYTYCEDLLSSLTRPGIFILEQGAVACTLTTQGQIALIRAESMEMHGAESVEFSFAILRPQ